MGEGCADGPGQDDAGQIPIDERMMGCGTVGDAWIPCLEKALPGPGGCDGRRHRVGRGGDGLGCGCSLWSDGCLSRTLRTRKCCAVAVAGAEDRARRGWAWWSRVTCSETSAFLPQPADA